MADGDNFDAFLRDLNFASGDAHVGLEDTTAEWGWLFNG
jgi:hypothetical protein